MAGFSGSFAKVHGLGSNNLPQVLTDEEKQELVSNRGEGSSVSSVIQRIVLDSVIGLYKPVIKNSDDKAELANSTTVGHASIVFGVSLDGGAVGEIITVAQYHEIYLKGHGFTVGAPIFINGSALSNTAPTTGFVFQVGVAPDDDRILFNTLQSSAYLL